MNQHDDIMQQLSELGFTDAVIQRIMWYRTTIIAILTDVGASGEKHDVHRGHVQPANRVA